MGHRQHRCPQHGHF
nr:hypothetical protein [Mycobacterium spongiae]